MSEKIKLNPNLVMPWSVQLRSKEPHEYPFKVTYRFKDKQLIYIASLHTCALDSKTFKMIRNVLEKESIDFLIVEGINNSDGILNIKNIKWAQNQEADSFNTGFETAFSIVSAAQKNIPFIGGEPDDLFILSEISFKKYTAKDLVFYYFMQQIISNEPK